MQAGVSGLSAGLYSAGTWRGCMGQLCQPSHSHPRIQPQHRGKPFHQQQVNSSVGQSKKFVWCLLVHIPCGSLKSISIFKCLFKCHLKGVPHWSLYIMKRLKYYSCIILMVLWSKAPLCNNNDAWRWTCKFTVLPLQFPNSNCKYPSSNTIDEERGLDQ